MGYAKDVAAVIGLGMVFAGLWRIDPPYALIIVGAVIAGIAIWGAVPRRREES